MEKMILHLELKSLANKINKKYDYDILTRDVEFYKLIVIHEGKDFLLTKWDIELGWLFFKNYHRYLQTGFITEDIRNFKHYDY